MNHKHTNKYLLLEYKYRNLAAAAYFNKHRIRYFVYSKLAKYYDKKYMKVFLGR